MFLLVAGNPAELQSLMGHFAKAGVPQVQMRGKTYEELAEMPPDDVPNFSVIVVAMSTSVEGWQKIATRLKGFAPESYLTCAFLGNLPKAHVDLMTKKTQVVGGSLMIITDVDPDRTRASIHELRQHLVIA